MSRQTQWLFEVPPTSEGDRLSYINPEYYNHPELEWEWELPEAQDYFSPLSEVYGNWEIPESAIRITDAMLQRLAATARTINRHALPNIRLILQECDRQGITDKSHLAYVLATAHHESGIGRFMVEKASGQAYEGRKNLGNISPGDGPKFKGRGFVQITGRNNYKKFTAILTKRGIHVDLLQHPHRAADPEIAAIILVHGMKYGGFTGKRLADFGSDGRYDFFNARRIVNPGEIKQNPATVEKFAATARKYRAAMNGEIKPTPPATPGSVDAIPKGPPVAGPIKVTSGWVQRRNPISGKEEFHHGVDISLVEGTPIRANMSGTVKHAGWESPINEKKGFGLYVVIKNGPYETYYAHLQKGSLRVKTGDKVRRGMVIAKSGSTGASTGGHLHYEVRVGKAKRDPKHFGVYPGAVWQA